jgi:hypothetical protein
MYTLQDETDFSFLSPLTKKQMRTIRIIKFFVVAVNCFFRLAGCGCCGAIHTVRPV